MEQQVLTAMQQLNNMLQLGLLTQQEYVMKRQQLLNKYLQYQQQQAAVYSQQRPFTATVRVPSAAVPGVVPPHAAAANLGQGPVGHKLSSAPVSYHSSLVRDACCFRTNNVFAGFDETSRLQCCSLS